MTMSEEAKYRAVFDEFDTDGDGVLTYDELKSALDGLGYKDDDHNLQTFIDDADPEKSGIITFEGFASAVNSRPSKQQNVAKMRRLFRIMDTDGSGSITLKDLKRLVRESGTDMPTDQLKQIILRVDKDGDRKVSFEEFAAHMSRK